MATASRCTGDVNASTHARDKFDKRSTGGSYCREVGRRRHRCHVGWTGADTFILLLPEVVAEIIVIINIFNVA